MSPAYQCNSNPLCWTFQDQARWVWDQLRWDHKKRFGLTEPHLTESVLAAISAITLTKVRVRKFSTNVEGLVTGADWEWWLGSPGNWVGMRVQAKKIDTHLLTYPELNHTSAKTKVRQVDRLISNAQKAGLLPLYCFYNYWRTPSSDPNWPCGTFQPDRELWGCSIAPAEAVRACVNSGRNGIADLATVSRPWMCLVCCPAFSDHRDLASRVFSYVSKILLPGITFPIDANDRNAPPEPRPWGVVKALPGYAMAVLDGKPSETPEGVAGVVVIADKQGDFPPVRTTSKSEGNIGNGHQSRVCSTRGLWHPRIPWPTDREEGETIHQGESPLHWLPI